MSAFGVRRVSAAIAVLAAVGLALLAIPLEHGTLDVPKQAQATTALAPPPPPPPVPLAPQQITERVVPTIVTITTRTGLGTTAGTGIVLRPAGPAAIVLTNHHVIDGGTDITAESMRDGTPTRSRFSATTAPATWRFCACPAARRYHPPRSGRRGTPVSAIR